MSLHSKKRASRVRLATEENMQRVRVQVFTTIFVLLVAYWPVRALAWLLLDKNVQYVSRGDVKAVR